MKADETARACSTHGNTAVVRTFFFLHVKDGGCIAACHVALPRRMTQIRAQTRTSYPPPPLSSQLHTVTVRENSFAPDLRSAPIQPGLVSYLSHSGMINVSFKQFDQPVVQYNG
jgi:hypothetical protein